MSRKRKNGDYDKLLLRPEWQRKRLEILSYSDFRCQLCGSKTQTLHVHHSYYESGKMPWEYPNGSMISLCDKHHDWYHRLLDEEREKRRLQRIEAQRPDPPPMDKPKNPDQEDLTPQEVADFIAEMRRRIMSNE